MFQSSGRVQKTSQLLCSSILPGPALDALLPPDEHQLSILFALVVHSCTAHRRLLGDTAQAPGRGLPFLL